MIEALVTAGLLVLVSLFRPKALRILIGAVFPALILALSVNGEVDLAISLIVGSLLFLMIAIIAALVQKLRRGRGRN